MHRRHPDAGRGIRTRRGRAVRAHQLDECLRTSARPADPIDETAPLGQNVWILDHYTRSKVECERLLWDLADSGRLRLTVIRPSWLFGERDRTTIPRLIQEFRWNRVSIVGKGDNPLSAVYAGVVADAAMLAAEDPNSAGEAYNVTSHCRITQREFLDMLADAIGAPRVTWHYPFWYAFYGGFSLELRERLLLSKKPPRVTRYGAWLLGRYLEYSTEKARRKLGWTPALSYRESIGANGSLVHGRRAGAGSSRSDAAAWSGSARD